MSEGQSPTATLTERREPSEKDVEVLHEIIVRAQEQNGASLASDRDRLFTAYEDIFRERGLDLNQDAVCFWLLMDILKPDIEGQTLLEKFEHVLRNKGIEILFDDDLSTRAENVNVQNQQPLQLGYASDISRPLSQDITDLAADGRQNDISEGEPELPSDDPPPYVAQLERMADAMNSRMLLRDAMDALVQTMRDHSHRRPVSISTMEEAADRIYKRNLKVKVLTHWHSLQQQVQLYHINAENFYVQNRSSWALGRVFDSARVNWVQAMEDERLRGMALYKMTLAGRANYLARKVDGRRKQEALRALVSTLRTTAVRDNELQNGLHRAQMRKDEKLAQLGITNLYYSSQHQYTLNSVAQQHYESLLRSKGLKSLGAQIQLRQRMDSTACCVRDFFLVRTHLSQLREETAVRLIRRLVLGSKYFQKWQEVVKKRKEERLVAMYKTYRRESKMRHAARYLPMFKSQGQRMQQMDQTAQDHHIANRNRYAHAVLVLWYTRSQQLKQHEDIAGTTARDAVLRKAFNTFTSKNNQLIQLNGLAKDFDYLHVQTISSQCLRTMGRRIFELKRRQFDADAFHRRHQRQMLRSKMDEWRRKAAEVRGEPPLDIPPATPARRRADQLKQLAAASTTPLFAPRSSFAARLRGARSGIERLIEDVEEMDEDDDDDNKK